MGRIEGVAVCSMRKAAMYGAQAQKRSSKTEKTDTKKIKIIGKNGQRFDR